MAVCDTAPPPPNTAVGRPERESEAVEKSVEKSVAGTKGGAAGGEATPNNLQQREKYFRAAAPMSEMPHQRNGHTCFVWDPRDEALAACGGGGGGSGAASSVASAACKRDGTTGGREVSTTTTNAPPTLSVTERRVLPCIVVVCILHPESVKNEKIKHKKLKLRESNHRHTKSATVVLLLLQVIHRRGEGLRNKMPRCRLMGIEPIWSSYECAGAVWDYLAAGGARAGGGGDLWHRG